MAFSDFRSQFAELASDTVTIEPTSGGNLYGEPSFSTANASTFDARVVREPSQIRDDRGNVIEASGTVWVLSTSVINASDRITLPDGSQPEILRVIRWDDEDGLWAQKILLGH